MSRENDKGEELEIVFEAPDENTANMIYSFLIGEGIPALILPRISSFTGSMLSQASYWGDISVPAKYAGRGREIVYAYLAGLSEDMEIEQAE